MEIVSITGTGSQMQGVGRLRDGRVAFVPGALPGERAEIKIVRESARYCEAELVRVLESSEERVQSPCPYSERCGGCVARHMNYEYSLRLKRQRVFDALSRIGGLEQPMVFETIGSRDQERCRNKAEYVLQIREGRVYAGYYESRSHRLLPVEDCLLQADQSVQAMRWICENLLNYACSAHVRQLVTRVNRKGKWMAILCVDAPVKESLTQLAGDMMLDLPELVGVSGCSLRPHPAHALDGACSCLAGESTMMDTLLDLEFELAPQAFFQVNPPQAEKLYLKALEAVGAGNGMRLLDAYCGAGTISLAAAARGAQVLGVEIVAPAIDNARANARRNGLEKLARFVCADAAREVPRRIAAGERFDAAILDPPRRGAEAELLNVLADSGIARIAYVSCNPSTLARDVKILTQRGYVLEWAQPVDMFPWTEHVETVCLLSKLNAGRHIELD